MLRTILAALAAGLFLTLGSVLLLYVDSIKDKKQRDRVSLSIVQRVFGVLLFLTGTRVVVEGREHIPENEAVLYIGNHRSIFDIIVGYRLVKGPTGFISKIEIRKFLTLRLWMERVNCLFMDRADIKQSLKVILEAIQRVREGISIWIYPEGTRSVGADPEDMLPFKEGSFKIAEKTGCKIVPVAMLGTEEIFEAHKPFIRRKTVRVRIGEPIAIRELPKEDAKRIGLYTQETIQRMLHEMKQQG